MEVNSPAAKYLLRSPKYLFIIDYFLNRFLKYYASIGSLQDLRILIKKMTKVMMKILAMTDLIRF